MFSFCNLLSAMWVAALFDWIAWTDGEHPSAELALTGRPGFETFAKVNCLKYDKKKFFLGFSWLLDIKVSRGQTQPQAQGKVYQLPWKYPKYVFP